MKVKVIIGISAIILVISLVVGLVFALNWKNDSNAITDEDDGVNQTENITDVKDAEIPSTTINSDIPNQVYTVTFLNDDKSIFKEVSVISGEAPVSPGIPSMMQGYIFDGWNTDISSVTNDMVVFPLREKVSNEKTVIAISDGYAVLGDCISLPISLCGKVDVCCFEVRITYDKALLSFEKSINEDACAMVNCDSENGVVYFNYVSTQNTTGQVDLCDVVFRVIGSNASHAELTIKVDVAVKVTDADDFENIECDVRNGNVLIVGR